MPFDIKSRLPKNTVLVAQKTFFHDNLILCVLHDTYMDIYTVDIFRVNESTWYNLHGMQVNKDHAMNIFNNIRL